MSKALHHQIISDARNPIADERRWTQHTQAVTRGRDRMRVPSDSARRVLWYALRSAWRRGSCTVASPLSVRILVPGRQKRRLRTRTVRNLGGEGKAGLDETGQD